MSTQDILLDNLTDEQKALLTRLAYVDYDRNKLKTLSKRGNVTLSDLEQALKDENMAYLGSAAEIITGVKTTQSELIEELENAGLGDIRLKKISQDTKTGFFALAFVDAQGNTGMSFRGTDVASVNELIKDSLTDAKEYITDNDKQVGQAKQFYLDNQNQEGQNYLYGHSLGGNLVEHIYSENYEDIANAFTVNPEHVDESLLDTPEKVKAFNDSDKFSCFVIGGDWVSKLKKSGKFENNINYVENSGKLKNNILSEHAVEAGRFNDDGSYATTTKDKAYKRTQAYTTKNGNKVCGYIRENSKKNLSGRNQNGRKNIRNKSRRNKAITSRKKSKYF